MASAASVFPDPDGAAAWRDAVDRVLKGARFDDVMVSATDDLIAIQPLYPKAEHPALQPRRQPGAVGVVQRIDHPDPPAANRLALADLEGGATGLTIVLDGAASARGFGVRLDGAGLDALLAGIDLDLIAMRLEAPPGSAAVVADAVAAWIAARGTDPAAVAVDFGLGAADAAAALALRRRGFLFPAMRADARPDQEAGATEAQELASLLAAGTAMLRALEAAGATPAEMGGALSFTAVADTDLLLTVAKLRALRRLWARIEEACGLPASPLHLHAETAWRAMTRRDPWTNLLRGSVGAAAAILGGADSLTVLPFTAPLGLPDPFARRLARNTGHVLLEEAHLARLSDPAAGAGAFEALTEALCDRAWALFQDIEAAGGFPAAMRSGFWPARLAGSRVRRQDDVATGRRPILGTTVFPDADAPVPPVLMQAPPAPDPGAFDLPSLRDGEAFERSGEALEAERRR